MLQMVACGQEKTQKQEQKINKSDNSVNQSDIGLVKVDFPNEVSMEYRDYRMKDKVLPKIKTIGNYRLNLKYGRYVIYDNKNGYTHEELINNVLSINGDGKLDEQPRIEIFDTVGRNHIKTLDYSDNPYLKMGLTNIQKGYPDFEYYKMLHIETLDKVKEQTTQYFTFYRLFPATKNYFSIGYCLMGATEDNFINKVEYTIFTYNDKGVLLHTNNIQHDIEKLLVLNNGKFLCYTYGNNTDVTAIGIEKFKLYDIQKKIDVLEFTDNFPDFKLGGFEEISPNIISTGIYSRNNGSKFFGNNIFIDTELRKVFNKIYTVESELNDKSRQICNNGYYEYFNTELFNQTKF